LGLFPSANDLLKRVSKNGQTSIHITLVSFYANRKRKAMPNQKKKGQDLTPVLSFVFILTR
jgi:hypothetical protein